MKLKKKDKTKTKDEAYSNPSDAYNSPKVSKDIDREALENIIQDKNERFPSREYDKPSKSANTPLEIQIAEVNRRKRKGKSWTRVSGVLEEC